MYIGLFWCTLFSFDLYQSLLQVSSDVYWSLLMYIVLFWFILVSFTSDFWLIWVSFDICTVPHSIFNGHPCLADFCCCSVLQCVAVCCSVLVLQCVAVCCSALQCVAVCCSVLQCIAVCCSALQCVAVRCHVLQCIAVCCSVLQCAAVCCSAFQCVAVCCSVLQCVAVCALLIYVDVFYKSVLIDMSLFWHVHRTSQHPWRAPVTRWFLEVSFAVLFWLTLVSFDICIVPHSIFDGHPRLIDLYRSFLQMTFDWYRSLLT